MLLLIGQLMRSRLRIFQRLFLPASVSGGCIGLALGPNGADFLPVSETAAKYPGILIGLVFATLPFASRHIGFRSISARITALWMYSSITILLQWAVGILFTTFFLQMVWSELSPGFGALIAGGFVGGHGTAAALGSMFANLGWPEGESLAMTSATVGILSSITGGLIWINWGSRAGHARFTTRFDQLPRSLRTGLLNRADREVLGRSMLSSSSLDSMAFHIAIVSAAAASGYYLTTATSYFFPEYNLPMFCAAYITASILFALMSVSGVSDYVDRQTMGHLGGALTDVLIVFGIMSIKPAILVQYAGPLFLLFLAGLLLCGMIFRFIGPRIFEDYWFERALFTWGWVTGITALAIALLRISDPHNESNTLGDFGLAYLLIAPIEVGLVVVAPALLMSGQSGILAAGTLLAAVLLIGLGIHLRVGIRPR